jgi:glycosyltransferase involved in cell wall biosynthesis
MKIIKKKPILFNHINPIVSIITVVFNNAEFIERAIKSVLSQRYPSIEYIIIDGGSTDESINIINKYQDQIYFFVSEKDNGIYDALNKGIRNSTGSVIGVLHSDDIFFDDYSVSNIINNMVKTNSEFCFSNIVITNRSMDRVIRYYQIGYFKRWMFRLGLMPPHPSCFIKKTLFDEFGLYSTRYLIAGDFDFMVRIFYGRDIKWSYLSQISVKMMTGGLSNSNISNKIISAKEINAVLKNHNIFSMYGLQLFKYTTRFIELISRPRKKS